jgi:ribosomal protein S18 acetylase RimI-like enzyme
VAEDTLEIAGLDRSGLDIAGLERIAADCWPPAATETLGGWRLGFMDGVTRRANSVLPLAWTDELALEPAIDAAEPRYHAYGLSAVFKLTEAALPAGLPDALDARGYGSEGESDVLARRAADFRAGAHDAHTVRLLDTPSPDWCALSFAGRTPDEATVLSAMARRIEAPRAFGLVEIDGAAACAGFAVCSEGRTVIAGVHTLAAARRQGAATSLMAALARWSAEAGGAMLVLQVECANIAASALYRGLGFERLYGYHYRVARG